MGGIIYCRNARRISGCRLAAGIIKGSKTWLPAYNWVKVKSQHVVTHTSLSRISLRTGPASIARMFAALEHFIYIFFSVFYSAWRFSEPASERRRINKFTAGRWTEHRVAPLRHRSYSRARQQSGVCGRPFYFSEAWRSLIIICSLCCARMQSNRNWDAARREKRQLKCLLCMERGLSAVSALRARPVQNRWMCWHYIWWLNVSMNFATADG